MKVEERIAGALLGTGRTVAVAESCTGGLIGHRLTTVPGSSKWFPGGVVAYDNAVKERLLGVKKRTLRSRGAVSAETAVEMARGARRLFGTAVALSVTGIAGPAGGTPEKPVGLVHAAAVAGRKARRATNVFSGGRESIRRRAADMALNLLLELIEEELG